MEKESLIKNSYDMIYLAGCAVNNEIPDKQKINSMNLNELFRVCQGNSLTACVAYALESAGIANNNFTQAKAKSIRKNILFDAERKKILKRFEEEKIWYMSLKGALLKEIYPKIGMRQMSDNDILYDAQFRNKVHDIMTDLGFKCQHFGKGNDDAYFKEPIFNFEMHHRLFSESSPLLNDYYKNIKKHLIKSDNYEYHFSNEDFYIYMIAHEYKHYSLYGTGVRSLLDTYVFLKFYNNSLDFNYINNELRKMNINEFEVKNRELAFKVFSNKKLTSKEADMLNYYIFSGTYGTFETKVKNDINKTSKKSTYIFRRIFPPMSEIKVSFPFFYRYKILIPVLLFIIRPIKALTVKRTQLKNEIKILKKIDKN